MQKGISYRISLCMKRARDGTRTRGLDLGKVALHQLSHSRISYCFVLLLNTRHNIQDNPLSVNHFYAKNKVRNYTVFSENSFNYSLKVYARTNRPGTFRFKHPAPERFFITVKFLLLSFLHLRQKNSRMPRHSCCEVRVMQLHDILLLRTSAILPEAISAGGLTPS